MSHGPLVLCIESATGSVGCAVGDARGTLAEARSGEGRRHAESLAPQIQAVMAEARHSLDDLGAVAVDVGPGLYTGLRVGITTALAMASALGVPMVPLGSLDVLARGADASNRPLHALIDARRGEVFHAEFRVVGGEPVRMSPPAVADPAALGRQLAGTGPVVLVGDGIAAYPEAFAGVEATIVHADPHAGDGLALAVTALAAGHGVGPSEIRPCYLREPDAVAKWGAA